MLPTKYQENPLEYYVYRHYDPDTNQTVYIGHGKSSRAWQVDGYRGRTTNTSRDEAHNDWAISMHNKGYLPCDYVEILRRHVSKSDACVIEQKLIRDYNPVFNKPIGAKLINMTTKELQAAKDFRKEGMSYAAIAEALNKSTMCVWRNMNGVNKNVL